MTKDSIVVMEFLVTFITSLLKRHKTSIGGTYYKQVIVFRKFQWGIKGGDVVGIHHQLSQ